jgi:hypothetical protein
MPAYLVRIIDTRDMVGFFVADEMDELIVAVDECTDPGDCEYIEMPPGGDPEDDDSKSEELPWAKAELSELWWSVVYGHSDDEWTEFFPGKPRKPRTPAPRRPLGPGRVVRFRKRS